MSIKVAVRVRPFNQREKERQPVCCVRMVSHLKLLIIINQYPKHSPIYIFIFI